jgi:hypothetical protein
MMKGRRNVDIIFYGVHHTKTRYSSTCSPLSNVVRALKSSPTLEIQERHRIALIFGAMLRVQGSSPPYGDGLRERVKLHAIVPKKA